MPSPPRRAAAWPGPLVKLEGDTFWHFLSKPLEVEVRENFRLLMRSMTAACVPFAKGGYDVLLEFSIPPGFLKTARTIVKDLDLHYVLLRPSREVCEARAASREEWPIEDYEKLRAFYERFEGQEQHLVADEDALVDALNGFGPAYTKALTEAVIARLGVVSQGFDADAALVNAAFRTLAAGAEALRWEPLFFDWFGGPASEARAMGGSRAEVYGREEAAEFRRLIGGYAPDRPERLEAAFFAAAEPEEMLIDEVEAIWAAIAERDDWEPLYTKIAALRRMGDALGEPPAPAGHAFT